MGTRQASDAQKITKDYTTQLKEITIKNDDIQRTTEDAREQAAVAERRVTLMSTEIEELRSGLEQAERSRKQAENDLMEANERSTMLHTQNTAFINQKRKIESELMAVKNEAEQVALKGGKKHQQKLETRCRELETELESEQRRSSDNTKVVRKLERKLKETLYANEEDKKNL